MFRKFCDLKITPHPVVKLKSQFHYTFHFTSFRKQSLLPIQRVWGPGLSDHSSPLNL